MSKTNFSCTNDTGAESHDGISCCEPGKDREGYKVVYEDNYISWSPKDVFEKAYKEIRTIDDLKDKSILLEGYDSLVPHQKRVIDELSELNGKIEKLDKFIMENPIYKILIEEEQNILVLQVRSMQNYFGILIDRVNNWNL